MLRVSLRLVAFGLFAALVLESAGFGQPAATSDRVYFRDKKDGTIRELPGEIKAAPGGYQVLSADKKVVATVSAADLIRVVPADIPGYDLKTILEPVNLEAKKEWEKARLIHAEMAKKSSGAPEKVRKYLEFRIAICTARGADDIPDDANPQAKMEEGAKLLDSFLTANKTGWEIVPVGQTLARIQVSQLNEIKEGEKTTLKRRFEDAARTWGKIARTTDLAADLKLDAALLEIDAKIRSRLASEAKGLIDEANKVAPAGPAKDRLAIYGLAVKFADNPNPDEGVKAIEAELAKTKDATVRATGYSMMGELYLAVDRPRDAMWQYLWVEAVYNQDKDELLMALARLSDVFRMQGDDDRSKSYREKMRRLRASF